MKNLSSYIDHTNLKPQALEGDIRKLCEEAKEYKFASVCVNPCDIPLAKELLCGSNVKVCTVIGFPLGRNLTETKVSETEAAHRLGCDEFDMVINVGKLKDAQYDYVQDEIAQVVSAAKGRTVKVIIETCLLTDEEKKIATLLSCRAGAHFVKTSTGFSTGGATVSDVKLMKDNCENGVLVKASAGIRTLDDALKMIEAGADRLGTSAGTSIAEK